MEASKKGFFVPTILVIGMIGVFLLVLPASAADKVVVVPLFGDSSSESEQAIVMTSYRSPVGMERTFTVTTFTDPVSQFQLVVTTESEETTVWTYMDGSYDRYNELSELFFNSSGQLVSSCNYDQSPPKPLPDAAQSLGESWGGAYIRTCDSGTPKVIPLLFTLLDIETVAVPAGTFNNCLKISRNRGNSGLTTIIWYAPGLGWIKRYSEGSGINGGRVYELSSFVGP